MPSPRSRNIDDKPKAKNWLENNKQKSQLFLEILNKLNTFYVGDFDGYVDFVRPQYRYNDTKIGDYTIVSARGDGSVELKLLLGCQWRMEQIHRKQLG